ncbi:DUF4296 domain-containing protein [Pontibacter sp. BT213]|uniref:DUF4296 domain-containing protein n=2 Tax=Pontibacter fetidus TaxID=2700082 RepID=A0A6B2H6G2_9BACT|nr:DUF4296 domain-containing protein [Pontibacter fetidus]
MVQILADVHIMESLIESNVSFPDTAVMVYNKEHKNILKKYGVSNAQFTKSYGYYGKNLEQMDRLYEIVLDTLTAREAKLLTKKGSAPVAEDTLQRNIQVDTNGVPSRKGRRLGRPGDVLMNAPQEVKEDM